MFTAIYRSKLSPLYWLIRLFGKDLSKTSDIDEDLFRVQLTPGIGHDAKVLVKTAKHIFCNIAGCDSDEITDAVKEYLAVKNGDNPWYANELIHRQFSIAVTEDQHDEIKAYLSGKTTFGMGYSELEDIRQMADFEARQTLRHRTMEKFTAKSMKSISEEFENFVG